MSNLRVFLQGGFTTIFAYLQLECERVVVLVLEAGKRDRIGESLSRDTHFLGPALAFLFFSHDVS